MRTSREASEDIAIDSFTCGELAVVKTEAVVEQDFDIGSDDAAAVLVDAVVQFLLYLSEAVEDGLAFTVGHMQGFVYFVGEERVFLHFAGKACAAQQVGVEQQAVAFGIGRFTAIVNPSHLSGSYKYQRAFLIIVLAAPVSQLAVYLLFQVNAIEAVKFLFMLQDLDIFEIYERDQRIERFNPQELIVIVDAADIYDVAHILFPPFIKV